MDRMKCLIVELALTRGDSIDFGRLYHTRYCVFRFIYSSVRIARLNVQCVYCECVLFDFFSQRIIMLSSHLSWELCNDY